MSDWFNGRRYFFTTEKCSVQPREDDMIVIRANSDGIHPLDFSKLTPSANSGDGFIVTGASLPTTVVVAAPELCDEPKPVEQPEQTGRVKFREFL